MQAEQDVLQYDIGLEYPSRGRGILPAGVCLLCTVIILVSHHPLEPIQKLQFSHGLVLMAK